jgi:hypothetical protein
MLALFLIPGFLDLDDRLITSENNYNPQSNSIIPNTVFTMLLFGGYLLIAR